MELSDISQPDAAVKIKEKQNCTKKHLGFAKYRHSRICETLIFFVVLCLNAVDTISDWLLYDSVKKTEKGLVYGPPDKEIIYGLLIFSIVGTCTFIFEAANIGKEIYTEKPWINTDLALAITIWIEDVPQILLNVLVASCREHAISIFQLVKASVTLIGIVLRIIISFVRYCSKKNLAELHQHTKKSCHHVTYRVLIMIGLILLAVGSSLIFVFTQTERTEDGKIQFEVPDTLFKDKYHNERFFHNVSLFFNHKSLAGEKKKTNWIRMVSIYDVRNENDHGEILKYEYNHPMNKIMFSQSNDSGNLIYQECYHFDVQTNRLKQESICNSQFIPKNEIRYSIIFKFQYTPHDSKKLFGDILYNYNIKVNDSCYTDNSSITNSSQDDKSFEDMFGTIQYFRTRVTEDVTDEHHLLAVSSTDYVLYNSNTHLIDVWELWQTGFSHCKMSGSHTPHFSPSIKVPCA